MQSMIAQLQEQGLTENEASVYCHLLRLGTVTIGPLVEATELGKQSVYNAITSLFKKGLITQEKPRGKPMMYTPHGPQALLEHAARRRQSLQGLLPELEMLRGSGNIVGDIQVVKGVTAFQTLLERQLKTQKQGTEICVLGAGGDAFLAVTDRRAFFTRYENIRIDRKLRHTLLMFEDQRNTNPAYTKRRPVETRYLPEALSHAPLPAIIWGNSVSLLLFGEEPQILHMTSKNIRDGYLAQFAALWKMASP